MRVSRSRGWRKFLRAQKAKIRREVADPVERERRLKALRLPVTKDQP